MAPSLDLPPIKTFPKFQVTRSQYFIGFIALVAILGLGVSSFLSSRATVSQAKILSDVETPAASVIFTQRETLVYATRLAQWSNGGTTRRNVQIARSLLAQRLAVIDTSGRSMGSRAEATYWNVMNESDAIVASAPPGILPESVHNKYNNKLVPIIDEILSEARKLVVSYQRSIDEEMVRAAQENARRDQLNLALLYSFLFFGLLFFTLNVRTTFQNYRRAGVALKEEQLLLEETLSELIVTQSKVVELKDFNDAKDAFISTVNHELRTPLTSIIGYIDVMREENMADGNNTTSMYLDVLDRNAQILLHLVESMLSLSQIDARMGEVPTLPVNINEVIDNAIFLMKPSAEKSHIQVTLKTTDVIFVEGDASQLNQIFINLLANAIKFSPDGSDVLIKLDRIHESGGWEYAKIEVSDHGVGIPQADLEHLFTRFFRASNANSGQFPGTGLGLAIVHQVIERHLGSIEVSSVLGKGTTFQVKLPIYLTSDEKLILSRRPEVLSRAISQLEASTKSTFTEITHSIGGAIGFYFFQSLGDEILELSSSIKPSEITDIEFEQVKEKLMNQMKREFQSTERVLHV